MATSSKVYLEGASGRIVCIPQGGSRGCAGETPEGEYRHRPRGRRWPGLNREPFTRMRAAEATTFRAEWGYVCDCEGGTATHNTGNDVGRSSPSRQTFQLDTIWRQRV